MSLRHATTIEQAADLGEASIPERLQWERIFKNPLSTAAAIDRLVHHSVILEFDNASVRADEAEKRMKAAIKPSRGTKHEERSEA